MQVRSGATPHAIPISQMYQVSHLSHMSQIALSAPLRAAVRAQPTPSLRLPGAPLSVLDTLPADALRVGDGRWFTGRPDAFTPPLAFYGCVEGRAPGYYELDTHGLPEAHVVRLLSHTENIVALQLPSTGVTPQVLQLLQKKTADLECLQLSGHACADTCVKPLIDAVAPRLKAFSLGGAGSGEFSRLPEAVGHVLDSIRGMHALEFLDISGLGSRAHLSAACLSEILVGKQLRGLSAAGCTQLDIASLLNSPALAHLGYLDARGTAVKRSLRQWHPADRLMHKLEHNPNWRCLQLPAGFAPRQPERLRALQEGAAMQYLSCDMHTLANVFAGGALPAEACTELQPGACEAFLHTCANLNGNAADVGRWMPIPRDRWDALAVRKKGAVYVLTELQALRAQGLNIALQGVELVPSRNAYGESCYVVTFTDTARHRYRVALMESEMNEAIRYCFVARVVQARGANTCSITLDSPTFRALRAAAREGDASLMLALNSLPL